jgi:hypothetical protein
MTRILLCVSICVLFVFIGGGHPQVCKAIELEGDREWEKICVINDIHDDNVRFSTWDNEGNLIDYGPIGWVEERSELNRPSCGYVAISWYRGDTYTTIHLTPEMREVSVTKIQTEGRETQQPGSEVVAREF